VIEKNDLARVLRLLADTIDGLDEYQIHQLLMRKAKLTFTATVKSRDASSSQPVDYELMLAKLNDCKDRGEARDTLAAIKSRDALEAFARRLKIHIVKHDRRQDIESKIIEFVIGGKLRTEAIQSLNLKGGESGPK
jgi:hypothetical protein